MHPTFGRSTRHRAPASAARTAIWRGCTRRRSAAAWRSIWIPSVNCDGCMRMWDTNATSGATICMLMSTRARLALAFDLGFDRCVRERSARATPALAGDAARDRSEDAAGPAGAFADVHVRQGCADLALGAVV